MQDVLEEMWGDVGSSSWAPPHLHTGLRGESGALPGAAVGGTSVIFIRRRWFSDCRPSRRDVLAWFTLVTEVDVLESSFF